MLKNLYLICGKSGSGKTWTVEKLHKEYGYEVLRSYTTRKPRNKNDKDHYYVMVSDYYADKENGVMATDTCYRHNLYWSRIEQMKTSDLYVIDRKGIQTLLDNKSKYRPFVVIYIDASENIRKKRMRLRGDTNYALNDRLDNDEEEFKNIKSYADFIVDGDSDDKWITIKNIIDKCEEVS